MKPNTRIYMIGDVHGKFGHILPAIQQSDPSCKSERAAIFLGDIESQRPFEEEIRPLLDAGIEVWFIHSNHDTDHLRSWENMQSSWQRNIHARVVDILGARVAGLGGIFRGSIWYPKFEVGEPHITSLDQYRQGMRMRHMMFRGGPGSRAQNARATAIPTLQPGLDLMHYSSIFYDDWLQLYSSRADILVTHEAPHCHPYGFRAVTELARRMGVEAVFHGHHHDNLDYRRSYDEMGFRAFGVGLRGIKDASGADIAIGEQDAQQMHRLPPR